MAEEEYHVQILPGEMADETKEEVTEKVESEVLEL